jgi:hypothetical protein
MNSATLANQEKAGERFAEAKGAHSLADLRKISWKDLTAPVQGAPRFGIVVDGYVLPMSAGEAFALGKQNDVPTITGCNREDIGGSNMQPTTVEQFQKQAQRYGDLAAQFLKLYPAADDGQAKISSNESAWDSERANHRSPDLVPAIPVKPGNRTGPGSGPVTSGTGPGRTNSAVRFLTHSR